MTDGPFRQHDQVLVHVPSPIYRQLVREWVALNAHTSCATTVRRWGRLEPALAGHSRPCDIVDAIDHAAFTQKDQLLAALTRLFHDGQQLAGRVVLQTMMPKLVRITLRTTPTSTDNAWLEDRHHITLAEFWDVLSTYPLHRRPNKIASNLAMDTLHRVSGARRRDPVIPLDPIELADSLPHPSSGLPSSELGPVWELKARAEPLSDLRVDASLIEVVTWGITRQVLTVDEGAMLVAAYPPRRQRTGIPDAAQRWGITKEAVRQRCCRAKRRLADAVRDELADASEGESAAMARLA